MPDLPPLIAHLKADISDFEAKMLAAGLTAEEFKRRMDGISGSQSETAGVQARWAAATAEAAAAQEVLVEEEHKARNAAVEESVANDENARSLHRVRNASLEAKAASEAARPGLLSLLASIAGFSVPLGFANVPLVLVAIGAAAALAVLPVLAMSIAFAGAVTVLALLVGGLAAFVGIAILAAHATGQINGPMDSFVKSLKGAADMLGKELAPIARAFLPELSILVGIASRSLTPLIAGFRALLPVVLPFLDIIGKQLISAFVQLGLVFEHFFGQALAGQGAANMQRLFALISGLGIQSVQGLLTNLLRLSNWFTAMLPTLGPIVGGFFSRFGAGIMIAIELIGRFSAWVGQHWGQITNIINTAWNAIRAGFQFLGPVIQVAIQQFQSLAPVFTFIANNARSLLPALYAVGAVFAILVVAALVLAVAIIGAAALIVGAFMFVETGVTGLRNIASDALRTMNAAFWGSAAAVRGALAQVGAALQALPGIAGSAASATGSFFRSILVGILNSTAGQAASAGRSIIQGLINGMQGMFGAAMATARNIVQGIANAIRSAAGISSPAAITIPLGQAISQGVEVGIRRGAPAAHSAASDLVGGLPSSVGMSVGISGGAGALGRIPGGLNATFIINGVLDPLLVAEEVERRLAKWLQTT